MCKEDGMAGMELYIESESDNVEKLRASGERLEKHWGDRQKHNTREQYASVAVRLLYQCGGTFVFTDAHRDWGHKTIWEAMGGELVNPAANQKEKGQLADEWAHKIQQGVYALSEVLYQDFGIQVLCVPLTDQEQRIRVITVDADFVVNPKGETAVEVWQKREMARAGGQVKASTRKMARVYGPDVAVDLALSNMSRQSLLDDARSAVKSKYRLTSAEVPQF